MKVLWFINNSMSIKSYRTFWVSLLLKEVAKREDIDLGICFLTNEANLSPFRDDGISYFPINFRKSFLSKVMHRLFHSNKDANNFNDYLEVVNKFKPDLINIYGTEREYAEIIPLVKCKCIVHLQGILAPLFQFWTVTHKNNLNVFFSSSPLNLLLGIGIYHSFFKMKKNVKRELKMLSTMKYISGRTDWDKHVCVALAPQASYFHIDEVIRDDFFESIWEYKESPTLYLLTTIGGDYYKGYDIVLRAAEILRRQKVNFIWKIFGLSMQTELVKIMEKMLGIKHPLDIHLMGHKGSNDIIEEMKKSHIYVHPSKIENSPNSVCEAMLVGMPIIASYAGGTSSLIQDKVNGLLFPNMDFYALAGTIITYAKQPNVLIEMGENARKSALVRHDKAKIVTSLISTYKTILNTTAE